MTSDQRRVVIADEHFIAGHLPLAESLCTELWEEEIRSPMLTALLGEILLLRNRPAEAEPLLREAVDEQYLLPDGAEVSLPWASHAELPLVEVNVNGESGHFLSDTGVGEALIDPELARGGKVESSGLERIHFRSGPAGQITPDLDFFDQNDAYFWTLSR